MIKFPAYTASGVDLSREVPEMMEWTQIHAMPLKMSSLL
jgi:hypothetical protein